MRPNPITARMQPTAAAATTAVQVPSTQRQWRATLGEAPCASSPIVLVQIPCIRDRVNVLPGPACQDHAHFRVSVTRAPRIRMVPIMSRLASSRPLFFVAAVSTGGASAGCRGSFVPGGCLVSGGCFVSGGDFVLGSGFVPFADFVLDFVPVGPALRRGQPSLSGRRGGGRYVSKIEVGPGVRTQGRAWGSCG